MLPPLLLQLLFLPGSRRSVQKIRLEELLYFLFKNYQGLPLTLGILFYFSYFFKRLYLFLEIGEGREKERERNISWLPLICTPTGDRTHNPDSPDRELNQQTHFAGGCLTNWATWIRATLGIWKKHSPSSSFFDLSSPYLKITAEIFSEWTSGYMIL